ncbi:MAG: hypothetical protein IT445_00200 [Phycisphaeraceae bacterium]|nr:hypothetical protein [Phycisphaeraceae bacterium]
MLQIPVWAIDHQHGFDPHEAGNNTNTLKLNDWKKTIAPDWVETLVVMERALQIANFSPAVFPPNNNGEPENLITKRSLDVFYTVSDVDSYAHVTVETRFVAKEIFIDLKYKKFIYGNDKWSVANAIDLHIRVIDRGRQRSRHTIIMVTSPQFGRTVREADGQLTFHEAGRGDGRSIDLEELCEHYPEMVRLLRITNDGPNLSDYATIVEPSSMLYKLTQLPLFNEDEPAGIFILEDRVRNIEEIRASQLQVDDE